MILSWFCQLFQIVISHIEGSISDDVHGRNINIKIIWYNARQTLVQFYVSEYMC